MFFSASGIPLRINGSEQCVTYATDREHKTGMVDICA